MNDLSGPRLEAFRDAFHRAFPREQDFGAFLTLKLEKNLDNVATADTWDNRLLAVVMRAQTDGWVDQLYSEACKYVERNVRLRELEIVGFAKYKPPIDVNVCFSLSDLAWVAGELVPRLQKSGISFTMPLRDDHDHLRKKGLTEALESAARTLLVMTPSFVADNWDVFNQSLAFSHLRSTKNRLLAVFANGGTWPPPIVGEPFPSVLVAADDQASWDTLVARLREPVQQTGTAPAVSAQLPPHQSALQAFVDAASVDPFARGALGASEAVLDGVVLQIDRVNHYKGIHDHLQNLESECGQLALELWAATPNWTAAGFHVEDIRDIESQVVATALATKFAREDSSWVKGLRRALERMERGLESRDVQEVRQTVEEVTHLPTNPMSGVNRALVAAVEALNLERLERTLREAETALGEKRSAAIGLPESRQAVACFAQSINASLYLHNEFQDIEDEVRLIDEGLNLQQDDLRERWIELGPRTARVCESGGFNASARLLRSVHALDRTLGHESFKEVRESFDAFRQTVTKAFNEIDASLLTISEQLRVDVGVPLSTLLRLLRKAA